MKLNIDKDILNCDNPLRAMNNLSVQLLAAETIYRSMLSLCKILQSCRAHIYNNISLLSFKNNKVWLQSLICSSSGKAHYCK